MIARLFFGKGYAAQRNSILYCAIKNGIDYLLFLDDDEYPVAVTKNYVLPIWSGQEVLSTHLANIWKADITNGHHCGYISPIPYIEFNDVLKEDDFRLFIKAISNEVVNWETIRTVMKKRRCDLCGYKSSYRNCGIRGSAKKTILNL